MLLFPEVTSFARILEDVFLAGVFLAGVFLAGVFLAGVFFEEVIAPQLLTLKDYSPNISNSLYNQYLGGLSHFHIVIRATDKMYLIEFQWLIYLEIIQKMMKLEVNC